jgi:hypothetical protein
VENTEEGKKRRVNERERYHYLNITSLGLTCGEENINHSGKIRNNFGNSRGCFSPEGVGTCGVGLGCNIYQVWVYCVSG